VREWLSSQGPGEALLSLNLLSLNLLISGWSSNPIGHGGAEHYLDSFVITGQSAKSLDLACIA
jgi:hypothetical protein